MLHGESLSTTNEPVPRSTATLIRIAKMRETLNPGDPLFENKADRLHDLFVDVWNRTLGVDHSALDREIRSETFDLLEV